MAPKYKFTKEEMVEAALRVVRAQGIDGLKSAFADYHGFAQRALSIRI